jgi:hypothetical protein
MKRRDRSSTSKGRRAARRAAGLRPSALDAVRQSLQPAPFRIGLPDLSSGDAGEGGDGAAPPPAARPDAEQPSTARMLADVATCLWYLRTRHFRKPWGPDDGSEEEPRARRALGRLAKGIDALQAGGVVVEDPTGKRYPSGGEAYLRPIQFQPTAGLTFEQVSETVVPVVYWRDRLIQRGEVFVAVPQDPPPQERTDP